MDTLIFSQTAIFRLQQLGSEYYRLTGVRHKLATQEGILNLLRESALTSESKVRNGYDSFVMELNRRQINALAERGIKIQEPLHLTLARPIRQAV